MNHWTYLVRLLETLRAGRDAAVILSLEVIDDTDFPCVLRRGHASSTATREFNIGRDSLITPALIIYKVHIMVLVNTEVLTASVSLLR
jgi:hypothetical protein